MLYFKYRGRTGFWAFILHRLSGLLLLFYLTLHIWVTHHLSWGEEEFDRIMEFLSSPLFKFLEIGLLGVILYHGLNGLRVILIDLGLGIEKQKLVFWLLMIIGVLIYFPVAYHLYPFK